MENERPTDPGRGCGDDEGSDAELVQGLSWPAVVEKRSGTRMVARSSAPDGRADFHCGEIEILPHRYRAAGSTI